MKQRFYKGESVRMHADALDNYGEQYRGQRFTVTHVATRYMPAAEFYNKGRPEGYHPGYDTGCGFALYDLADENGDALGMSLYDWELTR